METILEILIKILVESILITGILGFIFVRREERMKKTIEEEFKKRDRFFEARFNFKLRCLEDLLSPVKMQLIRSKIALKSYYGNDEYREKILKECNEKIRNLLLEKGYLIPAELLNHAEAFISHYDEWLQAYWNAREKKNDKDIRYVFTYNFPAEAELAFMEKCEKLRKELEVEGALY